MKFKTKNRLQHRAKIAIVLLGGILFFYRATKIFFSGKFSVRSGGRYSISSKRATVEGKWAYLCGGLLSLGSVGMLLCARKIYMERSPFAGTSRVVVGMRPSAESFSFAITDSPQQWLKSENEKLPLHDQMNAMYVDPNEFPPEKYLDAKKHCEYLQELPKEVLLKLVSKQTSIS